MTPENETARHGPYAATGSAPQTEAPDLEHAMRKTLTRVAGFLRPSQQIPVTKIRDESYRLARADLATAALEIIDESRSAPDPLAEAVRRLTDLLDARAGTAAAA